MLVVSLGSKPVKTINATTGAEETIHFTKVASKEEKYFWSPEPIRGGIICDVTPRKAGEKYKTKDGEEKVVLKDGLNLNVIVGTTEDVRSIAAAQTAALECAI